MGNPDKRSHDKVFHIWRKNAREPFAKASARRDARLFYSSIVSPGVMRSVFFAWNLAGAALNQ